MPSITRAADAYAEPPGGVVVEKEERLGALHHDVVRAHRHQVDADRVMASGLDREPELRADAVRARHHDRPAKTLERHFDQRSKAAEALQDLGAHRAADRRLYPFDQVVAGIDVDSGIAIGRRPACWHR